MTPAIAFAAPTPDYRIFLHHVYEYSKGVRAMILCTLTPKDIMPATERLQSLGISYFTQKVPAGKRVNLFFGRDECLEALKLFARGRALNDLSPEEDFILGAMLGYDICRQCERYRDKKNPSAV